MKKLVFFTPRRKQFPHRSFFLGMVLRSLVKVGWILIGLECTVCLFFKDFCCYAKRPSLFWGFSLTCTKLSRVSLLFWFVWPFLVGKRFLLGKQRFFVVGTGFSSPNPISSAHPSPFSLPVQTRFPFQAQQHFFLAAKKCFLGGLVFLGVIAFLSLI